MKGEAISRSRRTDLIFCFIRCLCHMRKIFLCLWILIKVVCRKRRTRKCIPWLRFPIFTPSCTLQEHLEMFLYWIFSHHVYTITHVSRFVKYYFWSDGVESNHHKWFCRPSPHHSATITDIFLADHRGIEPLLLDLESNVLPLTLMACGREDRIWTCGIYVPNVVFYQTELLP